jgi:hypothetical protein
LIHAAPSSDFRDAHDFAHSIIVNVTVPHMTISSGAIRIQPQRFAAIAP